MNPTDRGSCSEPSWQSRGARRLVGTAGVAVVALILAGCGSSSGKTSAAGTTATTIASSSAPTKAPIVLLVAAPLTGPFNQVDGTAGPVAQAWGKWVDSAEGGIDGHPVQVVVVDTKSDGAAAVAGLTQAVDQDHPIAVIASDAAIEAPIAAYLSSKNLPVVGSIGDDPTIWSKDPNFFASFPLSTVSAELGVEAASAAGAKNFGAVVCAEVPVCAEENALLEQIVPKYKMTYKGLLTAAATAPDYTAECLAMIQKGVDYLSLALGSATITKLITDCADQSYHGSYGVDDTSLLSTLLTGAPSGTKAAGTINGFPWWSTAPAVQQFRSVMTQYGGNFNYENPAATGTWASLELFRQTMANVGTTPTSADVFTAYWGIKNQTLGGLLAAPVTFTQGSPSPTINCGWLYSYSNGKYATTTSGASGNGASGDLQSSCIS